MTDCSRKFDNWVLVFCLFFKQIFSSKVPLDSSSFTVPLTPFKNWKKVTHSIWQNLYFSQSMDSHLAASDLHFRAPSHICQWSLNAFIQPNFMECLTNHWCTNSKDWPTLRNNSVLNRRISSFLRQPCWEKRHTSKWFTVLTEEVLRGGEATTLSLSFVNKDRRLPWEHKNEDKGDPRRASVCLPQKARCL